MEAINIGNITLLQFREICQKQKGNCIEPICPFVSFCECNGFGTHEIDPRKLWIPDTEEAKRTTEFLLERQKVAERIHAINSFKTYKVHYKNTYDYIIDQEFGEPSYATETADWTEELSGGKLIDIILNLLDKPDVISIDSGDNKSGAYIYINLFEPYHGTGDDITIDYEEVLEL